MGPSESSVILSALAGYATREISRPLWEEATSPSPAVVPAVAQPATPASAIKVGFVDGILEDWWFTLRLCFASFLIGIAFAAVVYARFFGFRVQSNGAVQVSITNGFQDGQNKGISHRARRFGVGLLVGGSAGAARPALVSRG